MHTLNSLLNQFRYYKTLGDKALARMDDEEIHWQPEPHANNIATIVKHMAGNMLSRWTDFLNTDGEKDWRNREAEFDDTLAAKTALMDYREKGWQCIFNALESLNDEDLTRTLYIRGEAHSVLEAIHRQLAHYAYHTGQIVFIAKTIKGADWESLSIPRHQSEPFNREKFKK